MLLLLLLLLYWYKTAGGRQFDFGTVGANAPGTREIVLLLYCCLIFSGKDYCWIFFPPSVRGLDRHPINYYYY